MTNLAENVVVAGNDLPVHFAARKIVSNIFHRCHVVVGNVECPVWPTVTREGSLDVVRWTDAAGNVRAMAKV